MNYNDKINLLKRWCAEKSIDYYNKYNKEQGISYIRYLVTNEISFKLSMLIDQDFENNTDFKKHVENVLNIHFDCSLKKQLNNSTKYIIEKINGEFLEFFKKILISEYNKLIPQTPYEKVITGKKANEVIAQFNNHWEYTNSSYWFPLIGDEPQTVPDKFFIMMKQLSPYWKTICDYINQQQCHIYVYGESIYDIEFCTEILALEENTVEECAYTDKNFTWFIYFSHEDTVSFAGTIVPFVKDILKNEKEHWNKFE